MFRRMPRPDGLRSQDERSGSDLEGHTNTHADSGVDMKRSFVSILEELSPFEALILGKLCDASSMHGESVGLYTADLPDSVRINKEDILGKSLSREVRIALWNLARLGCIHPESIYGGPDSVGVVTVTSLGEAFIKACTLKPKG
jgi:hypothetical protein